MTKTGPLWRILALVGLLVSPLALATPANAAGEIELLKAYVGTWNGTGKLTGANTETVKCRLTLKEGNQDKVNYSGRCAMAGTNLSINGTIAYVNGRYEAAMTSNATFSGVAVGKKSGDGVVFNMTEREQDEDGKSMDVAASITLKGGAISVKFDVTYIESGDRITATVPFTQ